ncbi:MAG TPA: hypothetical protein VGM81_10470 [Burkholderiaceae bacterium]|jgi:hypothetical protein
MSRFVRARIIAAAASVLLGMASSAGAESAAQKPVVYPSAGQADDERGNYYVSLLKLALSKADGAFEVHPSDDASVNLRVLTRMAAGQGIDVVWAPAARSLEHDFRRVPVPLDKGILGWRLLLIKAKDRARFASVQSLEQLKALQAGQVSEWVDTEILRDNGLPVVGATLYESLFGMLAAQRFNYLPRGVAEIEGEARNNAKLGLVIEPHLALHYPMCVYFFVARDNKQLADSIEQGLRRALKDGSLEKLFQQLNGPALKAANLGQRRVFELNNPTLPADTLADDGVCQNAPLVPHAQH